MAGYNSENTPNVRVTVLEDPNNSLQELFNPAYQKKQVPLHQRNLPKSFFVPPIGITHASHLTEPSTTDIIISHSKANSSPACLEALSCAMDSSLPSHTHQKSLDITGNYSQAYCRDPTFSGLTDGSFIQCSRYDPRIPPDHQTWGMTLEQLQEVHINYARHLFGNAANLAIYRPQLEPVNPVVIPTSSSVGEPNGLSPGGGGLHGSTVLPGIPSTSTTPLLSKAGNTVLNPASVAVLCSAASPPIPSSAASLQPNGVNSVANPCGGRLGGPTAVTAGHRTHPTKLPPTAPQHSVHASQVDSSTDVLSPQHTHSQQHNHQRQLSHGHPTQTQPAANLLGTHFRSCSQPVSMSIIPTDTNTVSNASNSSRPGVQPSHLGGTMYGLSNSSTLIDPTAASTPRSTSNTNAGALVGQVLHPGSSSGQLVQGLECLRLNTSTTSASSHLLETQTQQQQQQQQKRMHQHPPPPPSQQQHPTHFMIPVNALNPGNTQSGQGGRFTGQLPTVTTQHSHQGSMDSGVGQSLTGQSNASANQTPEHTVMLFCDSGQNDCGTEHMEGISYTNEDLGCTPLTVFDNIDISDISA